MGRSENPKTKYFNVRVDDAQREQIKLAARRARRSDSDWSREVLLDATRKAGILQPREQRPIEVIAAWLQSRPAAAVELALKVAAMPADLPEHVRAALDRLRK